MALCDKPEEFTVDFEQFSEEYDPENHFDDERKIKRKDICDFLNYIKKMAKDAKSTAKLSKHFYELNLVAKICIKTTFEDIKRLLQNGTRTFVIPLGFHTPQQLDMTIIKINTAIQEFQTYADFIYPIGIGFEIKGEVLRTGRMRNDSVEEVEAKTLLVLTSDVSYKYSSMLEIVYVHNLSRYIPIFKINDVISIDHNKILGRVVKIINQHVTILIDKGGLLYNYMDVDIPYYIENDPLTNDIIRDLDMANMNNVDFIFVPGVRNKNLLRNIRSHLQSFSSPMRVIAELDLPFLLQNFVDMCRISKYSDAFLIDKLSFRPEKFLTNIIDLSRSVQKPILGLIPIRKCKDFEKYENHKIIQMLDSMFIEKSNKQGKFPIIAKKLLPLPEELKSKRISYSDPETHCLSNCLKLTVKSIKCSAIIYTTTNLDSIPFHLSQPDIYCPVVIICLNIVAGKYMNLYRNFKVIMYPMDEYSEDSLPKESCMMKYGICYCRRQLNLKPGDFVLCTFETSSRCAKKIVKFCAVFLPEEGVVLEGPSGPRHFFINRDVEEKFESESFNREESFFE